MIIYVNNIDEKYFYKKFLIYVNFMLIYVNITDRQTDNHIKSIVRNLTKPLYIYLAHLLKILLINFIWFILCKQESRICTRGFQNLTESSRKY